MIKIITTHNTLKVFLVFSCADILFLKMVSQSITFSPKRQFRCFKPILGAIFVTTSTVKHKFMSAFYTWVILLTNQSAELGEKQLSVVGSRGCQISPLLMHVTLSVPDGSFCPELAYQKQSTLIFKALYIA